MALGRELSLQLGDGDTTPPPAAAPAPRDLVFGPELGPAAVLGLVYLGAALLSLHLSREAGTVATFWYGNGIAIAVLATLELRRWPLHVAAIAASVFTANLLWGDELLVALSFLLPNLGEILLAAALLRRGGLQGIDTLGAAAFLRLLALGAVLPAMVGATLGAGVLTLNGVAGFSFLWLRWFEGASVSTVSILPLMLALRARGAAASLRALLQPASAVAGVVVAVSTWLLLGHVPFPFVYLALMLTVAALRLGILHVAALAFTTSLVTAIALTTGYFSPGLLTASWQHVFIYLALTACLVPAMVLALTLETLRRSLRGLEQREAELQRANERLEQFVRIASHDLREPLNTVQEFSGLIASDHDVELPEPARQYLGLVRRAGARMRSLLDDMLAYTRLQRQDPGPKEAVALDELLADVRDSVAARLRDSGGELVVEPLPTVQGYRTLLLLLFQNLVGNALKFVPPGRRPRVRVHARRADDGQLEIVVADNGIGIAAKDLDRLFQPFVRLNLRKRFDGTGLGLVLCRDVAQVHGGTVLVRSTPGEGSEFVLRLPR